MFFHLCYYITSLLWLLWNDFKKNHSVIPLLFDAPTTPKSQKYIKLRRESSQCWFIKPVFKVQRSDLVNTLGLIYWIGSITSLLCTLCRCVVSINTLCLTSDSSHNSTSCEPNIPSVSDCCFPGALVHSGSSGLSVARLMMPVEASFSSSVAWWTLWLISGVWTTTSSSP